MLSGEAIPEAGQAALAAQRLRAFGFRVLDVGTSISVEAEPALFARAFGLPEGAAPFADADLAAPELAEVLQSLTVEGRPTHFS